MLFVFGVMLFMMFCTYIMLCIFTVFLWLSRHYLTTHLLPPPNPASRRALILLVKTRKLLKAENHAYTKEIEVLERNLNKCEEDESKLRGITQSQSSSVDELVRLVLDNEKTLDMIRVRIMCLIINTKLCTLTLLPLLINCRITSVK